MSLPPKVGERWIRHEAGLKAKVIQVLDVFDGKVLVMHPAVLTNMINKRHEVLEMQDFMLNWKRCVN